MPFSAPSSIKSKSNTRLKEAIATMPNEIPILIGEFEVKKLRVDPKKLITKLIRYKIIIPPIAAPSINLKFSVGSIKPLL